MMMMMMMMILLLLVKLLVIRADIVTHVGWLVVGWSHIDGSSYRSLYGWSWLMIYC